MKTFEQFINSKTLKNCDGARFFEDPNKFVWIKQPDLTMLLSGLKGEVYCLNLNQYQILNRDANQHDVSFADLADSFENMAVPIFEVDWHTASVPFQCNGANGFKAFIAGAKTIPCIILTKANDQDYRKIVKYPKNWTIENGALYDENHFGRVCFLQAQSVEQCQKRIDDAVSGKLADNDIGLGNLKESVEQTIERMLNSSNMSYPIGKVTRDEKTNSYRLYLDRDNSCFISLVYGFNNDSTHLYATFVSGDFDIINVKLTYENVYSIINLLSQRYTVNQLAVKARTFVDNSGFGYYPDSFRDYLQGYLIQSFRDRFPKCRVDCLNSGTNTFIIEINDGPIKYTIITTETDIRVSISLINFYIGTIDIENDPNFIDKFNGIVANINFDYSLNSVLQLCDLVTND